MVNFVEVTKNCAKSLLIVLNLLCMVIALTTLGFAAVDIRVLKQYGEEQSEGCFKGDVIIIAASLLLVAVAAVGCVGAVKDWVKMLNLYVGFVLIMVVLELLIAIYVSVSRYGLQFRVTEWIREDFYHNVTESEMEEHLQTWDKLQITSIYIQMMYPWNQHDEKNSKSKKKSEQKTQELDKYECCGLNNADDYLTLGRHIPISCCPRAFGVKSDKARRMMYNSCIESETYYKDGCEEEILYMLQSDSDYLIGVAVISFWFEACCILLAMWVSRHLRNSVQVYKNTVKY